MARPKSEYPTHIQTNLGKGDDSWVALRFHDGDNFFTLTIFKDGAICVSESLLDGADAKGEPKYRDETWVSDNKIPPKQIAEAVTELWKT